MKNVVHEYEIRQRPQGAQTWDSFRVAPDEKMEKTIDETVKVRVVLAEDHVRVRKGLRNLLERSPDIVVVGEAGDGVEAIALVNKLKPDVLLLDMEMPLLNGTQVAALLKEQESDVRILALSAHDDRQYILGMLDNGASGYLTKEEAPEVLVNAVRGVARGQKGWMSKRAAAKIATTPKGYRFDPKTLTEREMRILNLLQLKKKDKEIASHLNLNVDLIEKHVKMLCTKMGVNSRAELIARLTD